jgi:uncharacterized protein
MPRPFMTAEWVNLGIITYAVPPCLLADHVPDGVELDIQDGQAFVSLVAFTFHNTRVLGIPWPGYRSFPELNLRFYVRRGDERGVVFLREIVGLRLVAWMARTFFNENYRVAPVTCATCHGSSHLTMDLQFLWAGKANRITVTGRKPGIVPLATSEEHRFTELRCGYGRDRRGRTVRFEIEHPPWEIYPVESHRIDLDWGGVYGSRWTFLKGQVPHATVLAAGSTVSVHPRVDPVAMVTEGSQLEPGTPWIGHESGQSASERCVCVSLPKLLETGVHGL